MNSDETEVMAGGIELADLGIDPEKWAALGDDLKRQSRADMAAQRTEKPLPPDWYTVAVWDTEGDGRDAATVFSMVARGPKCGRYLSDAFDLRDDRDARRYAALLRAAGLPPDARPAALEDCELSALVRCVAGRTRNAVATYKRELRAE